MITLHYAKLHLGDNDIQSLNFLDVKDLLIWIGLEVFNKSRKIVYLLSVGEEVFVTENKFTIFHTIDTLKDYQVNETLLFLQEYSSFEKAYQVALHIKEDSELCYEKDLTELN